MTEYHRDGRRFIRENCEICSAKDDCDGIVVYLGNELKESGEYADADPTRFYFSDNCPLRMMYEGKMKDGESNDRLWGMLR
jgi:hypothetical protein